MALFQDKLSRIYHSLLPETILKLEIPHERFADCMDCFHCINSNRSTHNIKCCSYHPILPNYMVGAILSDHSPEMAKGRRRILEKIKNKIGVTPYGIIPPTDHQVLYNKYAKKPKGAITRSKELANALQCPYQSAEGLCTIWKYRTELCSTYHCASVGGQTGQRFWKIAFQYLTSMEQKLTLYVLGAIGYPTEAIRTNRLNPINFELDAKGGILNEQLYQKIWKRWKGQEIIFFENCFKKIKLVDKKRVQSLAGIEEQIQLSKLSNKAKSMLQNEIPHFLQINTKHPKFQLLEKNNKINLANGKILKVTPLQLLFLKGFNGTTPTLTLIKKGSIIQQRIVNLLLPLMKVGILKQV